MRVATSISMFSDLLILVILVFVIECVSADQICQSDIGVCPSDTCCNQDVCNSENQGYKCCAGDSTDPTCSVCPQCRKI